MYEDIKKQFDKLDGDLLINIQKFYNYVYENEYIEFEISTQQLDLLKDMIWYNMELNAEYKFGLNKFEPGRLYPNIMKLEEGVIISNTTKLLDELLEIQQQFNQEWDIVMVYTDKDIKNSNQIIIHKQGENPKKYNYYKKTTIIDVNENNIYLNDNVWLCENRGKIGEYGMYQIIYNYISNLISCCNSDKKIIVKGSTK